MRELWYYHTTPLERERGLRHQGIPRKQKNRNTYPANVMSEITPRDTSNVPLRNECIVIVVARPTWHITRTDVQTTLKNYDNPSACPCNKRAGCATHHENQKSTPERFAVPSRCTAALLTELSSAAGLRGSRSWCFGRCQLPTAWRITRNEDELCSRDHSQNENDTIGGQDKKCNFGTKNAVHEYITPLPRRRRAVVEHVSQVSPAPGAQHLRTSQRSSLVA